MNKPLSPQWSARLLKQSDTLSLKTIIAKNLGFAEDSISSLSSLTLKNELLRVALWSKYSQENPPKPVHILSLLRTAQQLAAPLSGKDASYGAMNEDELMVPSDEAPEEAVENNFHSLYDFHRESLGELEILGDIAELPNGLWLPAPLRVVALPAIQRWLITGGLPLFRLPQEVQQDIECGFVARFLKHDPATWGLSWPIQSQEAWCRMPEQSLAEWTERVFAETDLFASSWQSTMHYECYAPMHAPKSYQHYRWWKRLQDLHDGRYLARFLALTGRIYRIVEVRQGEIVASGTLPINKGDYRRLCYGLDARANCPVRAVARSHQQRTHFELENELPAAEYRLFTALGQVHPKYHSKYYPRIWDIPTAYAQQAQQALKQLGMRIIHDETKMKDL